MGPVVRPPLRESHPEIPPAPEVLESNLHSHHCGLSGEQVLDADIAQARMRVAAAEHELSALEAMKVAASTKISF